VPSLEGRVSCRADGWSRWIAAAGAADIDVMSGVLGAGKPRTDWRRWRWPLALGAAVLLVNVLALNIDWLRQQREADALRNAMVQVYRATFPKETVIIDPLAQMRQKMAQARSDAGELAAGDFLALATGLGDAWRSVAPGTPLASLEYRDRGLLLKLKPDARINMDALRNALAARNLSISQAGSGVWRVENAR
jgi:general secretion pathway protein L